MLWTIFVTLLLVLWPLNSQACLSVFTEQYTLGGLIHILLVLALVLVTNLLGGRRRWFSDAEDCRKLSDPFNP